MNPRAWALSGALYGLGFASLMLGRSEAVDWPIASCLGLFFAVAAMISAKVQRASAKAARTDATRDQIAIAGAGAVERAEHGRGRGPNDGRTER